MHQYIQILNDCWLETELLRPINRDWLIYLPECYTAAFNINGLRFLWRYPLCVGGADGQ